MIQSGEARYEWKHGIFPGNTQFFSPRFSPQEMVLERGHRISLQFSDFDPSFFILPEIEKLKKEIH